MPKESENGEYEVVVVVAFVDIDYDAVLSIIEALRAVSASCGVCLHHVRS